MEALDAMIRGGVPGFIKPDRRRVRNAKTTVIDGIKFRSRSEAKRYAELKLMERAGEIRNIQLQPKWELGICPSPKTGKPSRRHYTADFMYETKAGETVIEEVKGFWTDTTELRVCWFFCRYPELAKLWVCV